MIPAEFEYRRPGTVQEAVALLAESPEAKLLAGGMSLIPALKHRLLQPSVVVDIAGIGGLEGIAERRGRIAIGAPATHTELMCSEVLSEAPVMAEVARVIGDVQVRNRGTIGGSLVHADPAADWPALFLALDGEALAASPRGERTIAASEFFTGMLRSALTADEFLTEVRLELPRKRAGAAYTKMRQPASGFALVGVAALLATDRRGRIERAAIGVTGVNPVPFRAKSVEEKLVGRELSDTILETALASIDELDPMADIHASAEYRVHLTGVYAARSLRRAYQRARA